MDKADEFLCQICNNEDETSFICACVTKYEIQRKVLFSQALVSNNEFQDLCNKEKLV